MDFLKKIEGYKTKTGITLLVVTAFAYLGHDVTQAEAITFIDAVAGLAVLLSGVLANYGANDKDKRFTAKAKEIEEYYLSLQRQELEQEKPTKATTKKKGVADAKKKVKNSSKSNVL